MPPKEEDWKAKYDQIKAELDERCEVSAAVGSQNDSGARQDRRAARAAPERDI